MIFLIFSSYLLNFFVNICLSWSLSVLDAFKRITKLPSWISKVISVLCKLVPINVHWSDSFTSKVTCFSWLLFRITFYFSKIKEGFWILFKGRKSFVILVFWNYGFDFFVWSVFFGGTCSEGIFSVDIPFWRRRTQWFNLIRRRYLSLEFFQLLDKTVIRMNDSSPSLNHIEGTLEGMTLMFN